MNNPFNLWKSGLIFVDNVEKKNLDRKFKDKLVNKNVDNLWNSSKKSGKYTHCTEESPKDFLGRRLCLCLKLEKNEAESQIGFSFVHSIWFLILNQDLHSFLNRFFSLFQKGYYRLLQS